ncbi:hypothetical protein BOX15_Mlig007411g1 [Macrostomum lignano]|uniref:Uncharacterized protein n=1 Tax=Macrostomum lignano TaxID=282301 RepID=A0A267ENU3_9PLAT|nr:hypothetical protein BOX15_Mlig007411g1 [Macrostomum lignano]
MDLCPILDQQEIAEVAKMLDLPSEEVEFPPERDDSEAEGDVETEVGAAAGATGSSASQAAKPLRRLKKKFAARRWRRRAAGVAWEAGDEESEGGAADEAEEEDEDEDKGSAESLYSCRPDKNVEFYRLPDI